MLILNETSNFTSENADFNPNNILNTFMRRVSDGVNSTEETRFNYPIVFLAEETGCFPNTDVSLDSDQWLFDNERGFFINLPEVLGIEHFEMPRYRCDYNSSCNHFTYNDHEYWLCYECLTWFEGVPDYICTDNDFDIAFCSNRCFNRSDFFECEHCNTIHHVYDAEQVRDTFDNVALWCEVCFHEDAHRCDDCCEYVEDIFEMEDGSEVCSRCQTERVRMLHSDRHTALHAYGYRPDWVVYGDTRNNTVPTLGIELETDTREYDVRHAYIDDLLAAAHADRVFYTHDGSLRNGVEVTSHPMTLDEHISTNLWGEVAEIAKRHGFKSHDVGTCGLHIHFNTSFFGKSDAIRNIGGYKLVLLAQRFQSQFVTFSRRRNLEWCSFDYSYAPDLKPTKIDIHNVSYNGGGSLVNKAYRLKEGNCHAHSVIWNFQHSNTIECRLFRGSLNLETIYASMTFVQGMARFVKTHSEAYCKSIDWYSLIEWIINDTENDVARESFVSYLNRRGLWRESDDETVGD